MTDYNYFGLDYNFALNESANNFGQIMNISSVNYNQTDGTPTFKYSQRLKMEKSLLFKLANPEFRLLEYFSIYGYRDLYNPGDLIIPTDPNSSTPICTVVSYSPAEEAIAVRTSRIGSIYNGLTPLFTNVYFELVAEGTLGPSDVPDFEASLKNLHHRFIIYKRILTTTSQESEGLIFYEEDLPGRPGWKIGHTDERGDLIILDCTRSNIY